MSHDLINALQNILDVDVAPIAVSPAQQDIPLEDEAIDTLLNSIVMTNGSIDSEEVDHAAVDDLLKDFDF
ncbi:MAG TPA: hypothetical protein PLD88_11280, partial [Candidatus Berkiella sp.]|nr:hypothetical protein [Candidatus Berkiella sp.]